MASRFLGLGAEVTAGPRLAANKVRGSPVAPLVLLLALAGPLAWAGGPTPTRFARVEGRELVAPDGTPLRLKGINLGNWLLPEGYMWRLQKGPQSPRQIQELVAELIGPDAARSFWRDFRAAYVTKSDIRYLKRIGLDSVRVPFDYRVLTPEEHPQVWLDEGFALLDRLIEWCRDEGLLVVLDMHAAPGGQTGRNIDNSWGHPFLFESEESEARAIGVWRKLAERYRDEPAVLGYDLLNEPIPNVSAYAPYKARLEPFYRKAVAGIRELDAQHVIFLGGAVWDTDFSVFGPPFAPNLVYTFHKYWNPTDDASLRPFLAFRERYQVPLWLGETGENTDEWIEACRRLVERHGIGWCFWPYKKLGATSCPASIVAPEGWDEIVAYGAHRTVDFEANARIRPSLIRSRATLAALLTNIRLENCRINKGYLKALGLRGDETVPSPRP
jgi:aryl-phospho-beta-D-glucosidase BglC (GH1 family)